MSERYKIIFSLNNSLYAETSPVIIKTGALVSDTEKGQLHIQLKFQSMDDKLIKLLKARVVFMDSIGRTLGEAEKQYLDLDIENGTEFGGKIPIAVKELATRKFSATVEEVCFSDGEIWHNENVLWEALPKYKALENKFTTKQAVNEFKYSCCKQAKYLPVRYKNLWSCACGCINKEEKKKCTVCNAELSVMELADENTFHHNYVYRRATELLTKNNSADLKEGIRLLESIVEWKNAQEKIEEAKLLLEAVEEKEKNEKIAKTRKKKKIITIVAVSIATLIAASGISILAHSIYVKNNPYVMKLSADETYYAIKDVRNDRIKKAEIPTQYKGKPVKAIAKSAFSDCESLTSVTIPDSVMSIGDEAFRSCGSLISITISDSVTSIGDYAFNFCKSLISITIPDSVTSIGNRAFWACESLTSVKIGDSVTSIGAGAFSDCESLTSITIPDSVTSIGAGAFSLCESLISITIPDSVTSIGHRAFRACKNLISITIPDSVTSIGDEAFWYCGSLISITIPDSVTSIGFSAFSDCESLTSVTFKNPNGWWYAMSSSAIRGTAISNSLLADPSTAAKYLTSTYYYWKRG